MENEIIVFLSPTELLLESWKLKNNRGIQYTILTRSMAKVPPYLRTLLRSILLTPELTKICNSIANKYVSTLRLMFVLETWEIPHDMARGYQI